MSNKIFARPSIESMIFAEARSVLAAIHQVKCHSDLFESRRDELENLEKKLVEATKLKDETKIRKLITSVDFFLAEQGEWLKNRILELLPKGTAPRNKKWQRKMKKNDWRE